MYFDQATLVISEIGGYGDYNLTGEEFSRDDRLKRIESAAASLCDYVYEHLEEAGEFGDGNLFQQKHLDRIARMIAVGMMAQFKSDQKAETNLVDSLLRDKRVLANAITQL